MDGTDFSLVPFDSLVRFDDLKEKGYAGAIEMDPESMATGRRYLKMDDYFRWKDDQTDPQSLPKAA